MPNVHVLHATWRWDLDAVSYADTFRVPYADVETVAAHPGISELDPRATAEHGYEVRRHRRGDLLAVVGYRDPERPVILGVRVMLPPPRRNLPTNELKVHYSAHFRICHR